MGADTVVEGQGDVGGHEAAVGFDVFLVEGVEDAGEPGEGLGREIAAFDRCEGGSTPGLWRCGRGHDCVRAVDFDVDGIER